MLSRTNIKPNRWVILAAAIAVQVCLGVIFAWSAFATPLTRAPYEFTRLETQVLFSAGLASFALAMAFGAHRLQLAVGQRMAVGIGGMILAAGYVLAGFAGTSYWLLLLTVGVLAGTGIGLAYVHPIAILIKWFPDKKGFITGAAVAGFALGATLWIMLTGGFKFGSLFNLIPGWDGLYAEGWTVNEVFRLYGFIFALMIPIGSFFLVNPTVHPEELELTPSQSKIPSRVEMSTSEIIRTREYWILLACYAAGTMSGLMVIGIIKLFGVDALTSNGISRFQAAAVANTAMGFFYSFCNALGRVAWGFISDHLGRKQSIILMSALQGVMMLLFYPLAGYEWGLYVGAGLIGFNFGANFALFPAAAADYFGPHSVGANYPRVFLGYGIGGLLGPILGGYMGDRQLWLSAFIPAAIVCFAAAALATRLKPSRLPRQETK
jgi:MFS transporter, OFA family, oxalate/formate antiporter